MNPTDLRNLHLALSAQFPDCIIRWTNAGLLIAIAKQNATALEVKNQVLALIGDELVRQNEIVYRLFVYSNYSDQFKVEATLNTQGSDFEHGMPTMYRNATDADILMREIDFEYLSLANQGTEPIEIRNAGTGFDISSHHRYEELFVMGMQFRDFKVTNQENKWYLIFDKNPDAY
jgi:hypothetical protein